MRLRRIFWWDESFVKSRKKRLRSSQGFALVFTLLIAAAISLLIVQAFDTAHIAWQVARHYRQRQILFAHAEYGLHYCDTHRTQLLIEEQPPVLMDGRHRLDLAQNFPHGPHQRLINEIAPPSPVDFELHVQCRIERRRMSGAETQLALYRITVSASAANVGVTLQSHVGVRDTVDVETPIDRGHSYSHLNTEAVVFRRWRRLPFSERF
jgi:hypothetical protein